MRKQQRFFSHPSHKSFWHRPLARLDQRTEMKKREAVQNFRRRKAAGLVEGTSSAKASASWSPEQLKRIWQYTTG